MVVPGGNDYRVYSGCKDRHEAEQYVMETDASWHDVHVDDEADGGEIGNVH